MHGAHCWTNQLQAGGGYIRKHIYNKKDHNET